VSGQFRGYLTRTEPAPSKAWFGSMVWCKSRKR
jgi:hypothetical protein